MVSCVFCVGFAPVCFAMDLVFKSDVLLCSRWPVGDVASPYVGAIQIWNTQALGTLGPILNALLGGEGRWGGRCTLAFLMGC